MISVNDKSPKEAIEALAKEMERLEKILLQRTDDNRAMICNNSADIDSFQTNIFKEFLELRTYVFDAQARASATNRSFFKISLIVAAFLTLSVLINLFHIVQQFL